ncbi:MAG: MFS transporter [Methanocorpusculum sp.]|nr:MFS transporter [Methanocorpusculum sp.]MDE2523027.1 MFS transporter [Methanocorpusculum sp.]MDE2524897.1 MFS transporter [Methanocorpusculum sp.]
MEYAGEIQRKKRLLQYLCIIGLFSIFSTTIAKNPVLPLYAESLGAGNATIGLISAVSPFAGILLSFPVGVLSDHLGRRRLLLLSGVVFLLAPLMYLVAVDPLLLIPIRFFHGMATAILGPVVGAVIAEEFGEHKGEMMGTYSSATLAGRSAAPLIGGAVLSLFAAAPAVSAYHIVYLIAFAAGIPVFLLMLRYHDPGTVRNLSSVTVSSFRENLLVFFRNRGLRCASAAEMATYFCFGTFETFLPLYLLTAGISAWQTGIIFFVQMIIIAATKPFFGRLADRCDPIRQILFGLLLTGGSLGAFSLTGSFWLLLGISCVFGIGMSLSTVAANVYAATVAEQNRLGASMGALSSIMDIGHSAGPLIAGVVVTVAGYTAGFVLCLLTVLAVFGYIILGTRQ